MQAYPASAPFNPPSARPKEGKNAHWEGYRKRSRAQFLVVVDQSVRRGEATKMYLRKSNAAVPGGKIPPRHISVRIFLRIAATTALVLCDRDNLSPLKEFCDISSRVLSVAKTA